MARVQRNHFVSLWNWKTQKQSESMLRDNIFLHASLLQGKHFNTKKNSSLGWRVGGGEDEEMHSSWTEMCFYGPITGLSVILTEASKQTCQPSYEKWELPRPCLHLSFLSSQPKSALFTQNVDLVDPGMLYMITRPHGYRYLAAQSGQCLLKNTKCYIQTCVQTEWMNSSMIFSLKLKAALKHFQPMRFT